MSFYYPNIKNSKKKLLLKSSYEGIMSIKIKTDEFQKDNSEMLEKVAEKILKKHIVAFKELAK